MDPKSIYLDEINISKLLVRGIVGINPEERVKKQDIMINVSLFANLKKACRSDQIEDTVNYKEIKNKLLEVTENSSFFLVERLAEKLAEICLKYTRVEKVKVNVQKPGALRFAKSVGFTIFREKADFS